MPRPDQPLRVAYLVYRGNPHCGGQGVYTRELARELTALGHTVEVFSGQPYPELADPAQLDAGAEPRPVPTREPVPGAVAVGVQDPHRPGQEFAIMCARGLPRAVHVQLACSQAAAEPPRTSSTSCTTTSASAPGLAKMLDDGWPMLATLHHPDHRRPRPRPRARTSARGSGSRCAAGTGSSTCRRGSPARFPRLVTVSESSRRDIVDQMDVAAGSPARRPGRRRPRVFRPRARRRVGSPAAS